MKARINAVAAHPRTFAALALALLAGSALAAPPGVRHVRADAASGGDGLSWATAYNDLDLALTTAGASGGSVTELWVKQGTYVPAASGFKLVNDVGVYGGFAGVETSREQRDPTAHVTTLSGQLSPTFKVNNVVIGAGNAGTVLDGFTIRDGLASLMAKTTPGWAGGGIHITGSPTIRDCIITGNSGSAVTSTTGSFIRKGGGVYCAPGSSATLVDCTISGNLIGFSMVRDQPSGQGAGLAADSCAVTLIGCQVFGNRTGDARWDTCGGGTPFGGSHGGDGAGLHLSSAAALIDRCVIADNITGTGGVGPSCMFGSRAGHDGGNGAGLHADGSTVLVVNSVLARNRTGDGGKGGSFATTQRLGGDGGNGGDGAALWSTGGSVDLVNCTLAGNLLGAGGQPGEWTTGTPPVPGLPGNGAGVFADVLTRLENSIVWNDGVSEVVGALTITYSDVRGGFAGTGNISADPLFISASDYRLQSTSPCIDAGNSVPASGPLPATDLAGLARRVDIASVPDTGVGAPVVDMGAYEVQGCLVDLNGDGIVDFSDYLDFLNLFDAGDLRVDFTGDGIVDFSDYLEFLNLYDAGC